jgi:heat shock protein HtpX
MDPRRVTSHKLRNIIQTVLLLGGMTALLMLVGWLLAGSTGLWCAAAGIVLLAGGQRLAPQALFRMYRARRLTPAEAPALFRIVEALTQRARLPVTPRLYYIPSAMMNAFTVGQQHSAAIGVTDGLIRRLSQRELAGVLAHEISHILHRDTWVMGMADVVSRMTAMGALVGKLFLLLAVPAMLLSQFSPPWMLILVLLSAPTVSALLHLALSRTREFDADLEAAQLTGDPAGLASALAKLEYDHHGVFARLFFPGRRLPEPSLLRTHPTTAGRIARLRALAGDRGLQRHTPMPTAARRVPLTVQIPQVVHLLRWCPEGVRP